MNERASLHLMSVPVRAKLGSCPLHEDTNTNERLVERRRSRGGPAWLPLALLAFGSAGCAGHSAKTLEARAALDAGKPQQALALYNEELGVESGEELPEETGGDKSLLLLDRSMILQQVGDFESSSRDLQVADKEVEMLDFSRGAVDDIGKYIFSDDSGPYKAPPYEKLMVNTMNMVNYLARHDLNGARIEARRLAVVQKYLRDNEDPAVAMNAPGSYLAGFTFEKSGRPDVAERYYEEALEHGPFPSLEKPLERLRAGSPPQDAEEGGTEAPGELLVIIQYGRVPAKVAQRIPIGLALTYGSLYMTGGQSSQANALAAQGLVTWVNYPDLEKDQRRVGVPTAHLNGKPLALDGALDVEHETRQAYERAKGPIIASAITRMVTRVVAGVAAGEAAKAASGDGIVGLLFSLGTQAALSAADTPDTRSWATLPARIVVGRQLLPAGRHEITLSAQGIKRTVQVDLKPGGWEAVTLTVLR